MPSTSLIFSGRSAARGANFGVVTRFKFRLHELDGVVGGILVLPATAETIAGFIAAAEAAPEELGTIANVMPCPPMPFVAEEHHGKLVNMAMVAYAGDAQTGERVLAPFRALAEPLADMVRPIPYPEMYPPEDPDYHPKAVSRTMFIDHVDLPVARTIMDFLDGLGLADPCVPASRPRRRHVARASRRHGLCASRFADHGEPRRVLRDGGGEAGPPGVARRVRLSDPAG